MGVHLKCLFRGPCPWLTGLLVLGLSFWVLPRAVSSPPLPPDTLQTVSIGQPAGHRFYWGPLSGYSFGAERMFSRIFVADHSQVALPQVGALDFSLEAAILQSQKSFNGAFGLYGSIFGFRQGVEWDNLREDFFFRLSADFALRRGGILGWRDRLRVDYTPALKTLQVGLTFNPFWSRNRLCRPKDKFARIGGGSWLSPRSTNPPSVPVATLAQIESAMEWMNRLLAPRLTHDILDSKKETEKFLRTVTEIKNRVRQEGRSFVEEDSAYHAGLEQAFAFAAGGNEEYGPVLARKSEELIFQEILVPLNRLFGRKKKPFQLSGFIRNARDAFGRQVKLNFPALEPHHREMAAAVFDRVTAKIEEVAKESKKIWRDDRLVWLPLNYGLRPEQYDSQPELERVLGALMGQPFTHSNHIRYLLNEQWYRELGRMILETERYQVLMLHDFAGKKEKAPDLISWGLVTRGYIQAFIRAIEALDRGEREVLPEFTIFLDEHYYHINGSRKIMGFLEHLYRPDELELEDRVLETEVKKAHERLLKAIANSPRLRAKPKSYLKRKIKVNVNVTNFFEPSFSEDAVMRDHRKIAFRDVFEDDPSFGEAIFTGQGVGRLYLGPSWEDRSLLVRGPDLVRLKTSAQELFLSQGNRESEVPFFLKARPFPENYAALCDSLRQAGWSASLLTAMNATGYGSKMATVLKAALYNLMLPGSAILAPDSIWAGDFWAGMFVGAALRGCLVYAIAPAREQAPSDAAMTLELIRYNLASMVKASQLLKEEIEKSGGGLSVGLYDLDSDVQDLKSRLGTFLDGVEKNEGLKARFLVHPNVIEALRTEAGALSRNPLEIEHLVVPAKSSPPKLHLKAQFFINAAGRATLKREEWGGILRQYFRIRREEVSGQLDGVEGITPRLFKALAAGLGDSAAAGGGGPVFVMTLGSHNQDRRSMFLDGEALVAVSGWEALVSSFDFALLLGSVRPVTSVEEVRAAFPKTGSLMKSIAKWIKDLI